MTTTTIINRTGTIIGVITGIDAASPAEEGAGTAPFSADRLLHFAWNVLLAFRVPIWHLSPSAFHAYASMMISTPSRAKPLWAKGAARLIGFGGISGRSAEDALTWLLERCAEATDAGCLRVLIAGADVGVLPQTSALALARGLADTVSRVMLIDMSQGAPALSGPMELPRSPGLAELCQGTARFEDVVRRDPVSSLHFLASGKPRSLGGDAGVPGMLDKVCRAIDETYAVALFCAGHDEASSLARALKRPFGAGVVVHDRRSPATNAATDFASFGFPVFHLDARS
jgi:hypothetical protein